MNIEETFQMIRRAIRSGRPAHGYLIVGAIRGEATDLAVRILKTLFCRDPENAPCDRCEGCRHVAERTAADVHWIFPEKKSRIISAEQIRDHLLHAINQTAFSDGWKAGVIVGADRLNDASANAFLKTLEEPPGRTLFLLLSDSPYQLLPTIISRCQRVDLTGLRELADPWKSRVVETLSSPLWGRPLENLALSNMLHAILLDIKERVGELVAADAQQERKDEEDAVLDARINARYREMRTDFLLTLMRWFRDLFVLRAGGDEALVLNSSKLDLLRERAQRLTLAKVAYNLSAIEELARQFEKSLSEETALAYALDRINHGAITG